MELRFKKLFFCLFSFGLLVLLAGGPLQGRAFKSWGIHPKMSLAKIQAVIDGASDGDHIVFHKGTFDFSGAPMGPSTGTEAALVVQDKSLIIEGRPGNLIIGAPSEMSGGMGVRGITAFRVRNDAGGKSVTFSGLHFLTFMMGISGGSGGTGGCGDITVTDCMFSDIHRNGIAISGAHGDIKIQNNTITTVRIGIFIQWYFNTPNYQPDDSQVEIRDNAVRLFGSCTASAVVGIYFESGNQCVIENNQIVDFSTQPITGIGFYEEIGGGGTVTPHSSRISGNAISDADWGIELLSASLVTIESNILSSIGTYGIFLDDGMCTQNQIKGNTINLAGSPVWTDETNYHAICTYGQGNTFTRNIISGTGSTAAIMMGSGELFECNDVQAFQPALSDGAAHYVFFYGTHDNVVRESWLNGVTWWNYGDATNLAETIICE